MNRDELLKQLWLIETRFDEQSLDAGVSESESAAAFKSCLEALHAGQWEMVYSEADRVFQQSTTRLERAFALQWAIAAAEVQYDLGIRAMWLARWKDIEGWAEDAYCRYLRMYQDALTVFFEGALQEAEARFRKAYEIAKGILYERGEMRCLFHLGLVQRDRSRGHEATAFFQAALVLAQKRNASAYEARIEEQLNRLGVLSTERRSHRSSLQYKTEIEKCILERRLDDARRLVATAEQARRQAGLKRNRESYFIYLPFCLLAKNRIAAASRLLKRISDPLLKIRVLELKNRTFGLTDFETRELLLLREIHGVAEIAIRPSLTNSDTEICGIALSAILDEEVRLLMKLVLEAEISDAGSLTKEILCARLWNLVYNPSVHDGKIYKLIHKTRRLYGRKDLLVNTYGGYRLNPSLLAKTSSPLLRLAEETS